MRMRVTLHGIQFEWNSRKAAANLRKHGVSFEQACEVFFDPFVTVVAAGTEEEDREAAIGMTAGSRLLVVVHVLRGDNVFRIISARPATPAERRRYEDP
jgi:uncharacterized DUF497 family protein